MKHRPSRTSKSATRSREIQLTTKQRPERAPLSGALSFTVRRSPHAQWTSARLHADGNVGRSRRRIVLITHRPILLVMLALPTVLAAPSAFAQFEPELHNQAPRLIAAQEVHAANDASCPAVVPTPPIAVSPTVTSGGCRVHVASVGAVSTTFHLSAGGTEVLVGACSFEFDIRIDAAAEGWVTHQELTGDGCIDQACGQPSAPSGEGRAYSFHVSEAEPPARTEQVVLLLCVEEVGTTSPFHCEYTFPLSQPTTHRYRFATSDTSGHGTAFPHCELTGTFDVEAGLGTSGEGSAEQRIEIRHT